MLRPDSYRDPPLWVTPTGFQNSIWFRPCFRRYARTSSPVLKRRAGRLLGPFVTVSSKETSFNCRELTPSDSIKDDVIMTESVALEQQQNPTCANSAQAAGGSVGKVTTVLARQEPIGVVILMRLDWEDVFFFDDYDENLRCGSHSMRVSTMAY